MASSRRATLHLICGLPGSGKTTLAKRLEAELPALRLSPDPWMARIVGDGYIERKRAAIESIQWEIASRLLELGVDVILDWGFWSKNERYDFRTRASALGADSKIHYLGVEKQELLRRLKARNHDLPDDTFHVSASDLEAWYESFEPPASDELGG